MSGRAAGSPAAGVQEVQGPSGRVFWLGLVAIAALGAAQVSLFVDRGLTIDEPYAANVVGLDWPRMLDVVWQQETPLYHIVLKGWVSLSGESEAALRSLSVLCFALAIVTVGITAGRLGGRRAGWTAAFLMSVSYLGLHHAGTASKYALLGLQISVGTLLCFRLGALFDPALPPAPARARILCGALLVGVHLAGLLNHSIYLFSLVGISLAALWLPRRVFRALAVCSLLSVALHLALWGPKLLQVLQSPATSWMQVPGLIDLRGGVLRLWGTWGSLLLLGYLLVVALAQRQRAKRFLRSREGALLATALLLLVTLPFLVSQVRPVYYAVRTPALYLPLACVFLGLLLARLRTARGAAAVLLVLAVGSVWTCARMPPEEPGSGPARASVRYVVQRARCGDAVISGELAWHEVAYYLRRFSAPGCLQHISFPAPPPGAPDRLPVAGAPGGAALWNQKARLLVDQLLEGGQDRTVWFFYDPGPGHEEALGGLKAHLDRRLDRVGMLDLRGSFFERVLAYRRPPGEGLGRAPVD